MKVRVIAGVRDVNISDPLCGTWIEFVSFPMTLTDYASDEPGDPKITVKNEDELRRWADVAFEPEGYEIWDMEIPTSVVGAPAEDVLSRLQAIDREITAVNEAGFFTSDMTAAVDDLWQLLGGRAVVGRDLLSQAADALEASARRLSDDAHELARFPLEAEAVEGYEAHAAELREKARALRACAAPEPRIPTGAAAGADNDDQEATP